MEIEERKPQQWEMLASPGHVLLAQVDVYRHKTKLPMVLAGCAAALVYLAFLLTPLIGAGAGNVVGWIVGKASSIAAPKALPPSPAPAMRQFVPVFPPGLQFNPDVVPKLVEDVAPAMQAQVKAMHDGKRTTECDFTKKITENWSDGIDMTPKCRYSADGTRLWVWALVNARGRFLPFAGLIAKRDGQVTYLNVDIPGVAKLDMQPSIDPRNIPRAVAKDFPELQSANHEARK